MEDEAWPKVFGENGEKDERKVRENEMKREKGMWQLSQMRGWGFI